MGEARPSPTAKYYLSLFFPLSITRSRLVKTHFYAAKLNTGSTLSPLSLICRSVIYF